MRSKQFQMKCKYKMFGARKGLALVLLAAGFAAAAPARGAAYTILDLGTLGGATSYASGLNDSGQVVGYAFYATGASAYHAFRTTASGPITLPSDLGTLAVGTYSDAFGINASGQVVGYAGASTDLTGKIITSTHAFRTAGNGSIVPGGGGSDLGTLGGDSIATGINASGQAVGYALTTGNVVRHAFRTTANGPITLASDLGTFGGGNSYALVINASGQAVGSSEFTAVYGPAHAFRTAANGPITLTSDLGTLGGTDSGADAINNLGQTVGGSALSGDAINHAFFADVTGPMVDLNTLIDPASGWVLTGATAINDSGQIAGYGTIGGQNHAFLLTPTVPEPSSLSLLGVGVIGMLRRRRRIDNSATRCPSRARSGRIKWGGRIKDRGRY